MLSSRLRINGSSSTTINGLGRMDSVGREKVSAILCECRWFSCPTVTEIKSLGYH